MKDGRNFHLRLQEFCDCFLETDYLKELEAAGRWASGDPGSDEEELALKFLGLAILHGANQESKKFSLKKREEGEVLFSWEGKGTYRLPPPTAELADRVFAIVRSIMHVEEDQGTMPLSLGLRQDRLELQLTIKREAAEESLIVAFPQS